MARIVTEMPRVESAHKLRSQGKTNPTKPAKHHQQKEKSVPIWLSTSHSRNVVSLAGRRPLDVDTQGLTSLTDCDGGDASFAIARNRRDHRLRLVGSVLMLYRNKGGRARVQGRTRHPATGCTFGGPWILPRVPKSQVSCPRPVLDGRPGEAKMANTGGNESKREQKKIPRTRREGEGGQRDKPTNVLDAKQEASGRELLGLSRDRARPDERRAARQNRAPHRQPAPQWQRGDASRSTPPACQGAQPPPADSPPR